MGLHADGVDHGIGTASLGHLAHRGDDVGVAIELVQIEHVDPARSRPLQPLGHEVDRNHASSVEVARHPARHVADRPEPEYHERIALADVGVLHGLPRRR